MGDYQPLVAIVQRYNSSRSYQVKILTTNKLVIAYLPGSRTNVKLWWSKGDPVWIEIFTGNGYSEPTRYVIFGDATFQEVVSAIRGGQC